MKKSRLILLILLLLIIPIPTFALSTNYVDKTKDIVGIEQEENKINVYFFHGQGCPHCAKEEEFLKELEDKYKDAINIYKYETWYNNENKDLMLKVKEAYGVDKSVAVPFTIIGSETNTGYNDYVGDKLEKIIIKYLDEDPQETIIDHYTEHIPLLGDVNVKETSIFLVAIILGLLDGFNPCAMWILLFLINMLFDMKNKKRMLILGITFLFVSGFVYFLSMLGITAILSFISISFIRNIIGIVAVVVGAFSIKKYIENRKKDDGCHVVDAKKRKKIFTKIKKFTTEKNLFLALIGVIVLATSVNLIELACSTVFPATFAEILAINNVHGLLRIFYLLVYTLFYMLDDMIVFTISVCTLQIVTGSSKYGRYSSLISGIIMLLIGILLVFKPEWIMFNFS